MLRELPEEAPEWVTDLVQDLDTAASTRGGCEHGRAAYDDAAHMVLDYWEEREPDQKHA